ncbi:hypothetical protein ACFQXA_14045 [Nocardiopsis composta]
MHSSAPGGDSGPLPLPPPSEALRRAVRECLEDLDDLVGVYTAEVAGFAGYRDTVPLDDLRGTAHASLELLLRIIGGLPLPDRLQGISEELGRRRVHQGVPLEELVQAVRLDFRLLWTALLDRVSAEELPELTREAVRLWESVEFHTVRVHTGYLNETAVLAREREQQRAVLLGRLLASDGNDRRLVEQAATALRFSADARFAVVAAPAGAGSGCAARRPRRPARRTCRSTTGGPCWWRSCPGARGRCPGGWRGCRARSVRSPEGWTGCPRRCGWPPRSPRCSRPTRSGRFRWPRPGRRWPRPGSASWRRCWPTRWRRGCARCPATSGTGWCRRSAATPRPGRSARPPGSCSATGTRCSTGWPGWPS